MPWIPLVSSHLVSQVNNQRMHVRMPNYSDISALTRQHNCLELVAGFPFVLRSKVAWRGWRFSNITFQ